MMRLISAVAIILTCASAALAAESAPLTTLKSIQALSNAEAGHSLSVAVEATVTFFRERGRDLFIVVQEGNTGTYVKALKTTTNLKLVPGDRILIEGITRFGLRPNILANSIKLLYHGAVPKPVPATYEEMINIKRDNIFVTVRGVVRSADLVPNALPLNTFVAHIPMLIDGGGVFALVNAGPQDEASLKDLLDAEVEVSGVAGGKIDGKFQVTGVNLYVSSMANIKILHRAGTSPWSLPVTPMDQIYAARHVNDLTHRVRVQGSVTYYEPGSAIAIQNAGKSLWILTNTSNSLQIGDVVDVTGFPNLHDGFLTLTGGEVLDSHVQAPITPLPGTWDLLSTSHNLFDLVSIEGRVVTVVREVQRDEYVLSTDGQLFSAIYHHPPASSQLQPAPMKQILPGSKIRVTGICILEDSNPFDTPRVPFNILLRSPDDIAVVAGPPLLNIPNLILLVGLMLVVLVVVGTWGWILERRIRQKTAALATVVEAEAALQRRSAQLEQKRSQILEHINGSHPLAEILQEIAEMISFHLDGVPCWCEVADGTRLGKYPHQLESLRIHREVIPAHAGTPPGSLCAGFTPGSLPGAHEAEALLQGARLAALAIETRRLYSDLLHRSEFDLLTDVHNRFSLEKRLDALIEFTRKKDGIFGLIYIDLDKFKQINDIYGHQVGDLYLREVALRMKRELRSHDLLARLGGDEFAALITEVVNGEGVAEIALRMERCFDEPLVIEGYSLQCSASVGVALYPQDGDTKDSLLSAADAAMYVAKNTRKQIGQLLTGQRDPFIEP